MRRLPVTVFFLMALLMMSLAAVPVMAADGAAIAVDTGYITVNVYQDVNGDGMADFTEPNIAGATVYLQTQDGDPVATVSTDSEGLAMFSDVPYGKYKLFAKDASGITSSAKSCTVGEVNGDGAAIGDDIVELPIEYDLSDDVIMQAASNLFLPLVNR